MKIEMYWVMIARTRATESHTVLFSLGRESRALRMEGAPGTRMRGSHLPRNCARVRLPLIVVAVAYR